MKRLPKFTFSDLKEIGFSLVAIGIMYNYAVPFSIIAGYAGLVVIGKVVEIFVR